MLRSLQQVCHGVVSLNRLPSTVRTGFLFTHEFTESSFVPLSLIVRVEVDAEHEVAEGAVDVLAAALHGRLVGRVDDVDGGHGA